MAEVDSTLISQIVHEINDQRKPLYQLYREWFIQKTPQIIHNHEKMFIYKL